MNPHQGRLADGSIDAGLYLLSLAAPRDIELSLADIAFVCGCSPTVIKRLEASAIRKLKRRFKNDGRFGEWTSTNTSIVASAK